MNRPVLLLLSFILIINSSFGAESQLDKAKILIASNKTRDAIPVLEQLMKEDPSQAPHNYFLGLCLIKEGIRIEEAVGYLEKAAEDYSKNDIDPGLGEPEFCWYYLIIGYSRLKQCDKSMETYNTFVEVYSKGDPFYTNEAMKWIQLCHEPMRMAQEIKTRNYINTHSSAYLKDRLVNLQPDEPDVVTKSIEFTTSSILYGVQVGAAITPSYTIDLPGLKNVGVYVDENKVYRYVIGNLSFRSQAEELLAEVKAAGYTDAFIVDINQPERYGEEVVAMDDFSINATLKGKVEFRVQIGAFAEKLPRKLSKVYLEVGKIKEVRENDLTILTVGKFETYEDAQTHKAALQSQGFEDAFVTAFNKRRRIPVSVAIKHTQSKTKKELVPQKRAKKQ
ncbi:MAG: hypothetical protein QF371_01030 [Flavobacteriales bacterium]|nr:hypothetical protein [Flavobacteriales bacterium]